MTVFIRIYITTIAEWWVHSRHHSSGHQLHFDSDETGISEGLKAIHPIASCVVYLNSDAGGPTLVTNQVLGGTLADRGWMCTPVLNRVVGFDARYLHGVVPGRPSASHGDDNRLSFMVGFWRDICAKPRGVDTPGPGQPFPSSDSTYTWPLEMGFRPDWENRHSRIVGQDIVMQKVVPTKVTQVWCPIEESHKDSAPPYLNCFQGF
jgi:hypothetical protein